MLHNAHHCLGSHRRSSLAGSSQRRCQLQELSISMRGVLGCRMLLSCLAAMPCASLSLFQGTPQAMSLTSASSHCMERSWPIFSHAPFLRPRQLAMIHRAGRLTTVRAATLMQRATRLFCRHALGVSGMKHCSTMKGRRFESSAHPRDRVEARQRRHSGQACRDSGCWRSAQQWSGCVALQMQLAALVDHHHAAGTALLCRIGS